MMKNIAIVLATIAVVLAIVALFYAGQKEIDVTATLAQNKQENTITVTGEAETSQKPDTARVSFTITKKSPHLNEATTSVNERIDALIKALQQDHIKESDIKTLRYNVEPEYDWNDGNRRFSGYRVSQVLEIKIRDLKMVDIVLSKIAQHHVDNVSQLRFYIDDDDAIKKDLRQKAIKDAKENAKELAKDLGVELGDLISFNPGAQQVALYQGQAPEYAMADTTLRTKQAHIPTGENDFHTTVTLVYRIK